MIDLLRPKSSNASEHFMQNHAMLFVIPEKTETWFLVSSNHMNRSNPEPFTKRSVLNSESVNISWLIVLIDCVLFLEELKVTYPPCNHSENTAELEVTTLLSNTDFVPC